MRNPRNRPARADAPDRLRREPRSAAPGARRHRDDRPPPTRPRAVRQPSSRRSAAQSAFSARARAALPGIGQPPDARSWRDHRHPDVVELEQIAVAGHERIDASRSGERDEIVVAGVSADGRVRRRRVRSQRHDAREVAHEPTRFIDREVAPQPLARPTPRRSRRAAQDSRRPRSARPTAHRTRAPTARRSRARAPPTRGRFASRTTRITRRGPRSARTALSSSLTRRIAASSSRSLRPRIRPASSAQIGRAQRALDDLTLAPVHRGSVLTQHRRHFNVQLDGHRFALGHRQIVPAGRAGSVALPRRALLSS